MARNITVEAHLHRRAGRLTAVWWSRARDRASIQERCTYQHRRCSTAKAAVHVVIDKAAAVHYHARAACEWTAVRHQPAHTHQALVIRHKPRTACRVVLPVQAHLHALSLTSRRHNAAEHRRTADARTHALN